MKALSTRSKSSSAQSSRRHRAKIRQNTSQSREALAYLAGTVVGDAWLTSVLGLRVADLDFSQAFCEALSVAFAITKHPRLDERGYWLVRMGDRVGRFNVLRNFEASTDKEKSAWLRGFFDSEGNAQLTKRTFGSNCFERRIAMYSTDENTLNAAERYLLDLGIVGKRRLTKNSVGHKGTKPVSELRLVSSLRNFGSFRTIVGSSIARKRNTMDAIVSSYVSDLSESCKQRQRLGAAARRQKTDSVTLSRVILGIRKLIDAGTKPTQRACQEVRGFNSVQRYHAQAELVKMALNALP